jgi:hypothetical protein
MAKTRTPRKAQGLGDTIEQITEATGIKKLVEFIAGEDCGCEERKQKLNEWFPYRKPECLTEDEYNWLTETRILERETYVQPIQGVQNLRKGQPKIQVHTKPKDGRYGSRTS